MFEQLGPDYFIAHRLNLDSRVLYYLTCRSRGWVDEKPGKTMMVPTVYYVELLLSSLIHPMKVI